MYVALTKSAPIELSCSTTEIVVNTAIHSIKLIASYIFLNIYNYKLLSQIWSHTMVANLPIYCT